MHSEDWFLVVLLIVIGGGRASVGILTGKDLDGEATLGLFGCALGMLWGLRGLPRWRRRRRGAPGNLHDPEDADHAPHA